MAVRHSSGFRRERSAEQLGQVGGEQLVLLTLVGLVGAVSFTGLGTSASEAIGVSSSGGVPAASVSAMAGTVDGDDTSGGGGVPGSGGGSGTLSSEAGTVLPSDGASMDAAAVAAGLEAGGSGDAEGAGAVDGSGSVVSPASSEGGGGDGSGDGAGGFFSRAFGGIGRAVSGFGASVARITKGFFSGIGDGVTSTWLHFTGDAELAADAGAGKGGQCTWWNVVCHGKNVGSALWGGVKGLAKRIGRIPGWFMDKVLPKGDELAAGGIGAMPVGFDDVSFAAPAGGPAFNDISLASGAGLGGALDPEPPRAAAEPPPPAPAPEPAPPPPPPPKSHEQQLAELVDGLPYADQVNWRTDAFQGHLGTYCSAGAAPVHGCQAETVYIAPRVFDKPRDFQLAIVSHELAHVGTLRAYNAGDPAVVQGFQDFANKYTGGNVDSAIEVVADAVCTGWNMCGAFRHYEDSPSAQMVQDAMLLVR